MIEGLIILGIAAIVIVVALFGTTIISIGTSIVASISAMIMGAVTGTATLLTSWISWVLAADATTFYLGYISFAGWIALFGYSAFKIATSDKKKWMNLVGRGSNYLGIILIVFLVAQPLAVSYGSVYLADTTQLTAIDYVPVTQKVELSIGTTNVTNQYWEAQTGLLYDNDTYSIIDASTTIDIVTATTKSEFRYVFNTSFLATTDISTIKIDFTYVGTGNVTSFSYMVLTGSLITLFTESTDLDGSYTYTFEPYEASILKAGTNSYLYIYFADSPFFVSAGDYMEISVTYYEPTTIFTAEVIMLWLGASMAALDIIGLLYATGVLQKYIL